MPSTIGSARAVAVIPARYASSRFPGKPLFPIAGKPLILHVLENAQAASLVDQVLVATDDQRIFDVVTGHGGKAVMTSDRAKSGSDRVAEAIEDVACDIVVNIQGDEPLMRPETIDAALDAILRDRGCQVSTSCVEIRTREEFESPHNVKVVFDKAGYALYFSRAPIPSAARRGEEPGDSEGPLGHKHQGLYVYRKAALLAYARLPQGKLERFEKLEQLRYLENGYRIRVVVTDYDSPGVDTPQDARIVEHLLATGIAE